MTVLTRFALGVAFVALALLGCGSGGSSRTVTVPQGKLVHEIRMRYPRAEQIACNGEFVVHESNGRVFTDAPTCTWVEDGHHRAGTP